MQGSRKRTSRVSCSTLNSDTSVGPDFDTSITPIPRSNVDKGPAKSLIHKENLYTEDLYTKYLRSVYLSTLMNDKFLKEKSEISKYLESLSKELEEERNVLEKGNKRLKDMICCVEKEKLLKSQDGLLEDILNVLNDNPLKNLTSIIKRLHTIHHLMPVKNIRLPQDPHEIVEFQKVMDKTMIRLKEIEDSVHLYADTYSKAEKILQSFIESQQMIYENIDQMQDMKCKIQERIILHCSRKQGELFLQQLKEVQEGDDYILWLQKQFAQELMEEDGAK